MSDSRCQALKNSSHQDGLDIRPIRIGLLNNCKYIIIDILNAIIESLRMPYVLTFHKTFGEVFGEVVENRIDFASAYFNVEYEKFGSIDFSAMLGYGSPIAILSGKIFANTGNQFNIFNSLPTDLWIVFGSTLIIVATFEIFLHFQVKHSLLTFIMEILSNLFNLIIRFLNQNSNKYSRFCCSKHLILNSTTLISIFLLMLFFNSDLLSNMVYKPLLFIDSLDDLAKFLLTNPGVSLISDNHTSSWTLMETWQDDQVQMLFRKMQGVFVPYFDYEQVYRGKSIIIFFGHYFARIVKSYPSLKFHISNDQHFGTQFGLIYSNQLDSGIKKLIDRKIRSMVESGINNHWTSKASATKLNVSDDESHQSFSMDNFKNVIMLFIYIYIIIIIIFVVEYVIAKSNNLTEIELRRPSIEEMVESENMVSPTVESTQLNVEPIMSLTCS